MTFLEQHADVGGGPVFGVSEAFDDYGDFGRSEAFIDHGLVGGPVIELARAFLDGALNGVLGHGLLSRRLKPCAQTRVHFRIGTAHFGGHGDFFTQLSEQFASF